MKIDWKLKGFNLLKFICNKSLVLHPETCSEMLLMKHDSDLNLKNWITSNGTTEIESSLGAWLDANLQDIQVPYAGNDTLDGLGNIVHHPGKVYPGEGLSIALNGDSEDIPGELKINTAASDKLGGIKIGYEATGSNVPVQLDEKGKAYVTITGGGSNDSIIYRWDENNLTHIPTTLNPSAYIVNEGADNFSNINIATYITTIKNLFKTTADPKRLYPIRTDVLGHLYAFVPWTDTTYNVYTNTGSGLVPYNKNSTINTTAFLRKDGTWVVPSYNNLLNKPTNYVGNTAGFVPAAPSTGSTTKYLRADGSWAVPPDTNTTYDGDGFTVFLDLDNGIFSDPHQYTMIANNDTEISTFLTINPFVQFNKVNYIVPKLSDDSNIAKEIEAIFSEIGKLPDDTSCRFVYSFEDKATITATIDDNSASQFITLYAKEKVSLSAYGSDMTVDDDNPTITDVTKIQVVINIAGTTKTHYDLIFDVKVIEGKIYLALICEKQDVITNTHKAQ